MITASIVTYKNDRSELGKAITSTINSSVSTLYIVDNSPTDELKEFVLGFGDKIEYIFMQSNKGFGAGHNYILRDNPNKMGKYHIVLNPDVSFDPEAIGSLFIFMERNSDVGNVMPKIVYPNGDLQYLCKLLPTPKDWILRMFCPFRSIRTKIDNNFEMRLSGYDKEMNVPYLSGCFMFLRKSVIEEIGVFDEGIFMYGEDTDLNRRIHNKYRTMYFPESTVIHNFEKGSHKSFRLFLIHVKAAIYYLNKWGWFFDKERDVINSRTKKLYFK